MNKKTIIFVTASTNLRGGDFSLMSIIDALKKQNIKSLVIITKEGKSSEYWKNNGVDYLCIPFKTWTTRRKNVLVKKISFIAKRIYHNYLILKFKRNIKKIVDGDVLCVYNNGFTNYFAYELAKTINVKYIQHIREFGDLDFNMNFELGKIKTFNKIQKKCVGIIAISNAVKQSFNMGKNYDRIKVIYNGVKTSLCSKKVSKSVDKDSINIIMTGNLSPEKGQLDLIKSAEKLIKNGYKKFKIDIYGNGIQKAYLDEYIKNNNLDNYIELKGFVHNIDFRNYDIGIMASRSEGFGRVTVEYMMNGIATIASNTGANPEIISDNIDGLLYEYGNISDLYKKIKYLLDNKKEIISIGNNAIKSANDKFNENIYMKNILDYLIEIDIIN